MKFIISHDVDHLFGRDHWFRDLIYPKLWVKSVLHVAQGRITLRQGWQRSVSCLHRERHCLDALMAFDREHGVPSTFFFGMNQGLGMSYYPEEAKPVIAYVHRSGFSVGVHGIAYDNPEGIRQERETFQRLMGFAPCGIRMHYVRYMEHTFRYEADCGYAFDTTEFDKANGGTRRDPYRVGSMWEFPLAIMDGYLPQQREAAKLRTLEILAQCRRQGMQYVSVLFHDYQFNDAYSDIRDWYSWLIRRIEDSSEDSFISYADAVRELEASHE